MTRRDPFKYHAERIRKLEENMPDPIRAIFDPTYEPQMYDDADDELETRDPLHDLRISGVYMSRSFATCLFKAGRAQSLEELDDWTALSSFSCRWLQDICIALGVEDAL